MLHVFEFLVVSILVLGLPLLFLAPECSMSGICPSVIPQHVSVLPFFPGLAQTPLSEALTEIFLTYASFSSLLLPVILSIAYLIFKFLQF